MPSPPNELTSAPPSKILTAADGSTFLAVLEETPAGLWRASVTIRLAQSYEAVERIQAAYDLFSNFAQARDWVRNLGAARGFANPQPKIVFLQRKND